jgi:LPS-assembly protein
LKYDLEDSFLKSWEIGLSTKRLCWDYKISYKEELNPISTTEGSSSLKNKIIYFQINLIPLGGVKQKIKRQSRG